ncbi:MAG: isochorismatase family protein [Syntrophomonadaceae bacterium]|jgi:nicotinamidase-related amidase
MEMGKFRLDRLDSLLLIIDLQDKLLKAMKYRDAVVKNTNLLLKLAAATSLPVLVTEQNPPGLGPTVPEIMENFPEGTRVIDKMSFTACTPDTRKALFEFDRPKIIVTGCETHVCVYQTVRDLLEDGYTVHLVEDAVCSRFKQNYRSGLELMKQMGAVITNTESIFFDILKIAGTPEFKALSPLLK